MAATTLTKCLKRAGTRFLQLTVLSLMKHTEVFYVRKF
nr:MAG TPA: hypothetical protein [Bacteriophage sp.]